MHAWADCTPEQRRAVLEEIYADGSLKLWLAGFAEMFFVEEVSEEVSEFVREKMRARLKDQRLIDMLVPTDYGFGTHRVPLESGYLEVYHRDNVELVGVRDNPIARIVPEGIELADGTVHELDIIVLATGFDAGTGALTRIDIRGRDGRSLTDDWGRDIRTTMGLQVHGYPNLFTTAVPLAPSAALCNMTTCLQQQTEWISDVIRHVREQGGSTIEPTEGGRGRLGRPPRGDRQRHPDREDDLLVPRLERAGQAAPGAVLHRRRRHLPAEVRRGGAAGYPGFLIQSHRPRRSTMASRMDGSAIDKVLEEAVGTGAVPHVAAIAADRDGVIYEGGAGVRVAGESDDPVTTATQFRIMSMTKMVCTTAALQQLERGSWTSTPRSTTYVPAFADLQVLDGFDGDTPRLRPRRAGRRSGSCDAHGGLGYWFWDEDLKRYEQVTGVPNVVPGSAEAFKAPLLADPGTRFNYGINIDWLGRVVEAVAGTTLDVVVKEGITGPLGMGDTMFRLDTGAPRTASRCTSTARTANWVSAGEILNQVARLVGRRARAVLHAARLHPVRAGAAARR